VTNLPFLLKRRIVFGSSGNLRSSPAQLNVPQKKILSFEKKINFKKTLTEKKLLAKKIL